jgi:hypothetical protein
MTKFEEEFNYLIELSGKVLIGQVDAEAFEKNRIEFFEKYETDQQQALPVVPEFVGEAIEKDKQANVSISDVFEATFSYENHHLTEAGLWTKNNPEQYIVARNIGYTVQKPKRFYLKNKLTGKYLNIRLDDGTYEESDSKYHHMYRMEFTKQEIDSMQTGSYEKIEVEEEE